MSLDSDIDLLRAVPLFADFSDEQLRLLAFGAEDRDFPAGTILFEEGDRADSAFIVARGAIDIRGPDGATLLTVTQPGALIGETALMTETTRANGAITSENTTVVQIRRSLFRRILREFPDLTARLYTSMAKRLSGTITDLNRVRETLDALEEQNGVSTAIDES